MAETNAHKGHRERLRRKLINSMEALENHELLELLLFSAIPRKNTNDAAHELIGKFGGLCGVIEADYDELCKVDGIGPQSAATILLVNAISRRYLIEKNCTKNALLTRENVDSFIIPLFHGYTDEKLFIILLDAKRRVISYEKIADGAVGKVSVDVRSITKKALGVNAHAAILAHNHPNGILLPSKEDIDVTKLVDKALAMVDVRMVDHIIVGKDEALSMFEQMKKLGYKDYK